MILVAVYGLSIFSVQYLLRKTAQTILHCALDKSDKDARHPPCKREGCDKMFGKLKNMFGAKDAAVMILAPVEGEVVPVTQVSDPTFGEEILGKGVAIKPERGRVVAPVSGEISLMFDTGHAVSIVSDDGAEVLVHVGLDTVSLKGQFYTAHVKTGDRVKTGDLLIEFDMDGISGAGYQVITPVVVCNSADYSQIETFTGKHAGELEELIRLRK